MGWAQRSRRHLPPGTVCYLCGAPFVAGEEWNLDHVPPQRFYGKAIRSAFNPNLGWLPTHPHCNSAYKADEEYYVASFAGHTDSDTGRSVFNDFRGAVAKGHDVGLLKTILSQFGKVTLADSSIPFNFDTDRTSRIVWKLVRGLYFEEVGRVLPEDHEPRTIYMLGPEETKDVADKYPWWLLVRNTQPMGKYGRVFDYKWLGLTVEGGRGHMLAMLLWERLLLLVVFHDPSCPCGCVKQEIVGRPSASSGSISASAFKAARR